MKIDRLQTASRQLDTAIELLFGGADPVAVHTLASAAAGITMVLSAQGAGGAPLDEGSWEADGLTRQAYSRAFQATQKLSSYADRDSSVSNDVHEFSAVDVEYVLFRAISNLRDLLRERQQKLSPSQAVFQFWFIASYTDATGSTDTYSAAIKVFGDMTVMSRLHRLAAGQRMLAVWRKSFGS